MWRDLAVQILLEFGGRAVEEEEDDVVSYVRPPADPEAFLRGLDDHLSGWPPDLRPSLTWRWQHQEDWEVLWRRGLAPRRITSRIVVAPSWESVEIGPGEILVTIDPGVAFGTAEHASTRGCLRLLDARPLDGLRVADVGAGSGILSIAAALLGAREVVALEMDELACDVATQNASLNRVSDRVRVIRSQVGEASPLPEPAFDGIVANLQTALLLPLLGLFHQSLRDKGWMVLSGIQQTERSQILSATDGLFLLDDEEREDGWWAGSFTALTSG